MDQMMSPGRVLVVEDDPEFADNLESVLDELGFEVHAVATAELGLDRLLVHSYQCLLTDQVLPGRRGTEMIEAVVRAGAALPCVLVTALDDDDVVHEAISNGAFAVICKGTHAWLDELISVLARVTHPRSGVMLKSERATFDADAADHEIAPARPA